MYPTSVCVAFVTLFACTLVCVCVGLSFQLQHSCCGLLLVAIMGVFVCVCVSGWSSLVSLLLIVLYCSALAVPEGRGWLGWRAVVGVGGKVGWQVL